MCVKQVICEYLASFPIHNLPERIQNIGTNAILPTNPMCFFATWILE